MMRPSKHARGTPPPKLSKTPWTGYAPGDHPRAVALDLCPSARCRRAKACIAAAGGLFCQRTHLSAAQQQWHDGPRRAEFEKRFPPLAEDTELEDRRARLLDIIAWRAAAAEDKIARWKAGEFDALYGPWKARGVLVRPPVRVYVEQSGRARNGDGSR